MCWAEGGDNMKYSLLENGTDSLKAAFTSLENFQRNHHLTEHNLKDAIIFFNHGIEILLKYILKERSPSLMFSNIDKYLSAKEKMKRKGATDVFEIDPHLRTITLEEALKRVEYLCDIDVPDQLKGVILYINKIRNRIMHYGIDLNEKDAFELTKKLNYCLLTAVEFLSLHIPEVVKLIEYARFEPRNYTLTKEELEKMQEEFEIQGMIAHEIAREDAYAEMMEQLMENEIQNGK
mgnify:CR=1 FL=1